MTPVIVFAADEAGRPQPLAAFGSPGGPTIINTALSITLNLIDHRLAIQTAIDAPRLSLTSAADDALAAVEPGFAGGALQQLAEWGYPLTEVSEIGSVQAAVIDVAAGAVYGGADGRRRGTVAGLAPLAAARP
jgi:gamma-glutamyltranspeptidase/glutathione hydrolase